MTQIGRRRRFGVNHRIDFDQCPRGNIAPSPTDSSSIPFVSRTSVTTNAKIDAELASYADHTHGAITSGCGGGYLLLATEEEIPNAFSIRVRR